MLATSLLCSWLVQDLESDLRSLRTSVGDPSAAIARIAGRDARDEVLARLLFSVDLPEEDRAEAGWSWGEARDERGVTRPYQLYVPVSVVASREPCALLVHLHGAVSRGDFSDELGSVGYGGMIWVDAADEHGFALAFPLGRSDCKWWTAEGVANVRAVLRDVKRRVAVDDDRIAHTGFSDGASGGWFLSMAAPDPFAGFITMNGHPRVAAVAGSHALDLRNLALSPMMAAMTQDDSLYPAWTILRHVQEAMRQGAAIRVLSHPDGGHQPAYFEEHAASFVRFVLDTRREAFPAELRWFTDRPTRVRWLEFVELGPAEGDAAEPPAVDVMSVPGRVRLGCAVDFEHLGDGVRVPEVAAGSLAETLGMRDGDVVVAVDAAEVAGFMELRERLAARSHGDPVAIRVRRAEELIDLEGSVPPFRSQPIYRRGAEDPVRAHPAFVRGWAEVRIEDAELSIVSRGVRRLRIHLMPGTLAVEEVSVRWNGRVTKSVPRVRDLRRILADYATHADWARATDRVLELRCPD